MPKEEQEKLQTTALTVVKSFQSGCQPILNIGLVGHADKDAQMGPAFERRISAERSQTVRRALEGLMNNPGILSRISWQLSSLGASSPAVPNPTSELERARNRRVEIFLGPIPLDGVIVGVTVDGGGASVRFLSQVPQPGEFDFDLYRDQPAVPVPLLPRAEWMRRGAMLGLAQRAFSGGHRVKVVATNDVVQSMEIYKP